MRELRGVSRQRLLMALVLLAFWARALPANPDPEKVVSRVDGAHHFEELGLTVVRSAGDMDGDGIPEIIAGLKTLPFPGNNVSARVYSGASGALLLSIPRPPHLHTSPNPVASLADLDGDGLAEFIVGTPDAGVARVFSAAGTLLGTLARPAGTKFGASVSAGGDTDADGIPDFLVGAPGEGAVYVYSGHLGPPVFPLIATIPSTQDRSRFGASVASFDPPAPPPGGPLLASRIVVGAPLARSPQGQGHFGCVHVFALDGPGGEPRLILSILGNLPFALFGTDVDGGADFDGDGFEDFLGSAISADIPPPEGSGQLGRGYVTVHSGRTGGVIRTFQALQIGDLFGFSARFGGPCENGRPTAVIGAPQAARPNPDGTTTVRGRVLVYSAGGVLPVADIYGESKLAGLGVSTGGYSDVTGDGSAEFLAGSHGTSAGGLFGSGSVYVFSCVDIPRPDISAEPVPLLFGSVAPGGSIQKTLSISNDGSADLLVDPLAASGPSSAAFSMVDPGPFSIAPGESRSVSVTFSPAAPGLHNAQLTAASNDPDEPIVAVALGGKGILRKIGVAPNPLAFGTVEVGAGTGDVVSVTNEGNTVLSISGIDGPAGDFSLAFLPEFPAALAPGESLLFVTILKPSAAGPRAATIEVASDDPENPVVELLASGTGTLPNPAPTAVIAMDVPYSHEGNAIVIPFRGDQSFDTPPFPANQVLEHLWDFAGFGSSTSVNPVAAFPCSTGIPCVHVVRLEVTDAGGKTDPTSVSVVSLGDRPVRSRFYGRIRQGSFGVPAGTAVEAWIEGQKVASALTQVYRDESVYAIEVPTDLFGPGGSENDIVQFRYRDATANETGIWLSGTDQELDLSAPMWIPPFQPADWCWVLAVLGMDVCGPSRIVPDPGLLVAVQKLPLPFPDPGPLKVIGEPFELEFFAGIGGERITRFAEDYQIRLRYSDRQLALAGVTDETSIGLYVLEGRTWTPAAAAPKSAVDVRANELVASLNHASSFALLGRGAASVPVFRRGDCNEDGTADISDAVCTLAWLFLGAATPGCIAATNTNGDGATDISDPVYLLSFLFLGGPAPLAPFPGCGESLLRVDLAMGCAERPRSCP